MDEIIDKIIIFYFPEKNIRIINTEGKISLAIIKQSLQFALCILKETQFLSLSIIASDVRKGGGTDKPAGWMDYSVSYS